MKPSDRVVATFVVVLFGAVTCSAQEKRIDRSDVPPAVEKTIASATQGAKIRGFFKEGKNGETYYEVQMIVSGRHKDVQIDAKGSVTEVEDELSINSLPAAVKDGLQAKAGMGKLIRVESLIKHNQLVAYEGQVIARERDGRSRLDRRECPCLTTSEALDM